MVLRTLLVLAALLSAALVVAPAASAAPCDSTLPTLHCEAKVTRCDVTVGANVITTTFAATSADCRAGNMTRCYVGVGVGQFLLDPTLDHWCAF
ncbi:MAG: hypothetical protein ACPGQL_07870 [Thermoplasmatota archaeon]